MRGVVQCSLTPRAFSKQIASSLTITTYSEIFDDDCNGEVDFKEFIQGVSQFSVKGDKNSKLRFAFKIYDIDNDGYISNGELFQVLKMMVGNNLKDTQLQQIVDKTILFADKDGDGKISFEEFCDIVGNTDVHKKMVVDV